MAGTPGSLLQRRSATEDQWRRFVIDAHGAHPGEVGSHITSSWQRCADSVSIQLQRAPTGCIDDLERRWRESPVFAAAGAEIERLKTLAAEGSYVAAISDHHGELLWTHASRHMRERAEAVNFTAGGRWHERAAGTNAVGLSLTLGQPVTVFSSEHFLPFVHDWVCYAAPLVDPGTGRTLGVLDVSTTWRKHTPLGHAAITELARSIVSRLPTAPSPAELTLRVLGAPSVRFRGKPLNLTPRQLEILCLLSLNPSGLQLDALHAALYGDAGVSKVTLKAELSQLRRVLAGGIGSRPYRLTTTVWADVVEIWKLLRNGQVDDAVRLYGGPLLPRSDSPELEQWRRCIDGLVDRALTAYDDPSSLLGQIERGVATGELVRARLLELTS
ncbi:MAG: transcriptional regulator [Pseudomonadota bacterium]